MHQWFIFLKERKKLNQRQNSVTASLSSSQHNFKNFRCINPCASYLRQEPLFLFLFLHMLIQRHLQKIVFTADEAHGASHPDRFRWASLRPIQRERSRDYSSWRSVRQVWALIRHAFQHERNPTGVIPLATASSRTMFALTTKLPCRMTHWGSRKNWSMRGKVWKLGCVTPLSRSRPARYAHTHSQSCCRKRNWRSM